MRILRKCSDFYSAQSIKAYGYGSLHAAIIDSQDLKIMNVRCMGLKHPEVVQILCRGNSTCTVVCKNNACQNLLLTCLDGAVCKIRPARCKTDSSVDDVRGIICPTVTMYYGKNLTRIRCEFLNKLQ